MLAMLHSPPRHKLRSLGEAESANHWKKLFRGCSVCLAGAESCSSPQEMARAVAICGFRQRQIKSPHEEEGACYSHRAVRPGRGQRSSVWSRNWTGCACRRGLAGTKARENSRLFRPWFRGSSRRGRRGQVENEKSSLNKFLGVVPLVAQVLSVDGAIQPPRT